MDAVLSFGVGSEFNQVGKESPFSSGYGSAGSSKNSSGCSTPDPAGLSSGDEMMAAAQSAVDYVGPLSPRKSVVVPEEQGGSLYLDGIDFSSDDKAATEAAKFFENFQGPLFENFQGPFENFQGPFENFQGPLVSSELRSVNPYIFPVAGVFPGVLDVLPEDVLPNFSLSAKVWPNGDPSLAELNSKPDSFEDVLGLFQSSAVLEAQIPPSPIKFPLSGNLNEFQDPFVLPLGDLTNSPQKTSPGKMRSTPKKVREAREKIVEQIRDKYGDRPFTKGTLLRSLKGAISPKELGVVFNSLVEDGYLTLLTGKILKYKLS